jgi:DNA-binding GntR family transcriptional regulator
VARAFQELTPIRVALEDVAIRSFAGDLEAIEGEFEELLWAAAEDDRGRFIEHHVRFHELLVAASLNGTLRRLWKTLRIHEHTRDAIQRREPDLLALAEGHRSVLEHLRAGDANRASAALRRHLERLDAR